MLLCDGCNMGYHLTCLNLQDIPETMWYCESCDSEIN